jgi:cytochrome c biogenesis protein CcmG/thiol:disulfide interchange protein DsbE
MALRIIPLALFVLLIGFFAVRLLQIEEDPGSIRNIPSPLIGKPVPAFELPRLHDPDRTFGRADLLGKVSLVVVWASWCPECIRESPLLLHLGREGIVNLYALNYKDDREDALRWLERFGDPYRAIGHDETGRVGMDWGVYGAPEAFVVDKQGIIRDKYIGPIGVDDLRDRLLPMLKELQTRPEPPRTAQAAS